MKNFTFIDLFAGIGGFRIAFEELDGTCVFSSEIDKYSQETYNANFGEFPHGDITKIPESEIPDHDILLAGFPCQAFSIAGKKKGFEDTRGTLFFDIARIIKVKRPKAFFLENVKGLVSHDRGATLKTILEVLRNDLNYFVPDPQVINAKDFGVAQNRERIFIIGFRNDTGINEFEYPKPLEIESPKFKDIKEKEEVAPKYYLSKRYLNTLKEHRARHLSKGNGFGYQVIKDDDIANAIVVGGMGRERNLVIDHRLQDFSPLSNKGDLNREGYRAMTPREWARLQGFPEEFKIVVSNTQAYKQFGNSLAIPAVRETGRNIIQLLKQKELLNKKVLN